MLPLLNWLGIGYLTTLKWVYWIEGKWTNLKNLKESFLKVYQQKKRKKIERTKKNVMQCNDWEGMK